MIKANLRALPPTSFLLHATSPRSSSVDPRSRQLLLPTPYLREIKTMEYSSTASYATGLSDLKRTHSATTHQTSAAAMSMPPKGPFTEGFVGAQAQSQNLQPAYRDGRMSNIDDVVAEALLEATGKVSSYFPHPNHPHERSTLESSYALGCALICALVLEPRIGALSCALSCG